jgi:hypothetical protein
MPVKKSYKFRLVTVASLAALTMVWACSRSNSSNPAKSPLPVAGSAAGNPDPSQPPTTAESQHSIRCGVDDGPASVLGLNDSKGQLMGASSSLLAKRAPMQTRPARPPNGGAMAPRPMPTPVPPAPPPLPNGDPVLPSEPPLQPPAGTGLVIERLSPRPTEGASMSGELAAALEQTDPQFQVCQNAFKDDDQGTHNMMITLAKGGDPVRVSLMSAKEPSAFQRCLMERCCKLHGSSNQTSTQQVVQPIRSEINDNSGSPPVMGTVMPPEQVKQPAEATARVQEANRRPFFPVETSIRLFAEQAGTKCGLNQRPPRDGGAVVIRAKVLRHPNGGAFLSEFRSTAVANANPVRTPLTGCVVTELGAAHLPPLPANKSGSNVTIVVHWLAIPQ